MNSYPSSRPFQLAVVAPTFNNARTLPNVLDALATTGLTIIVVNDGCTDGSAALLAKWHANDSTSGRHVVTHDINRGKAQAMQSGFARARQLGFTHALTIDTDSQHSTNDVPPIAQVAQSNPRSLVIGVRPTEIPGYPVGSRIGRFVSNLLIWLECGQRVRDSQCGLRVYPLLELAQVPTHAGRFGFETEVVTRFVWAGGTVREMPIECVYDVAGGRTSHFRPWKDSWLASIMHMHLLGRALMPWPVKRVLAMGEDGDAITGTVIQRVGQWFNPMRTWRQIQQSTAARQQLAVAAGVGALVAALPLWGLKNVLCLLLAKILRAPPLVLIGSSSALGTPPLGALLATCSLATGHLAITGNWPTASHYNLSNGGFWTTFKQLGMEWLVGGAIVGAVLGMVIYFAVRLLTSRLPDPHTQDSGAHNLPSVDERGLNVSI